MGQITSAQTKTPAAVEAFIARWQGRDGGQERANYAMFLTELCAVLDVPQPDPAGDPLTNDYVFERVVKEQGRKVASKITAVLAAGLRYGDLNSTDGAGHID